MSRFEVIALDADDTLWENIDFFLQAQDQLADLLCPFVDRTVVESRLFATETKNIPMYGYGTKSFILSMVELAVELSNGAIPAVDIIKIHEIGRRLLTHPLKLLPGVAETVPWLAERFRVIVLTKGEQLEQRQKLERSGLVEYTDLVYTMSDKRPEDYMELFRLMSIAPEQILMVGNSLKSDILPILKLGGHGIYIPYHYTWEHEIPPEDQVDRSRFLELQHFGQLKEVLDDGAFVDL